MKKSLSKNINISIATKQDDFNFLIAMLQEDILKDKKLTPKEKDSLKYIVINLKTLIN